MSAVIDPRQIAKTNPAVDAKKIEQALAYRRLLEKVGVFRKADYRLSPPLGALPRKPVPRGPHVVRMTQ